MSAEPEAALPGEADSNEENRGASPRYASAQHQPKR
jgi:hypothetical protein